MRLFQWSKMHAVFIPEIDAEHKNMFRLADELRQAALPLLEFLSGWLRDHIRLADCMMAARVRNYQRGHAVLAS